MHGAGADDEEFQGVCQVSDSADADDRGFGASLRGLIDAAQCDRLCDALGDHWSSVIIDVLVAMLSDADERVRAEAVLCVPRLADVVLTSSPPGVIPAGESSVLDALIPAAIKLQKDVSASVRVALATSAGELQNLATGRL